MVDSEIQTMLCCGQSDSEPDGGVEQLKMAKSTLQALYNEIQVIKDKARHAERTVQNITKDIKSLDCAKRNITQTVTVLRRLQMLGTFRTRHFAWYI
jgi:septal ring factor EnvC (AmiA/AmiB activator)